MKNKIFGTFAKTSLFTLFVQICNVAFASSNDESIYTLEKESAVGALIKNLQPQDEDFINQLSKMIENMPPAERLALENESMQMMGELENFVEAESEKLGITPLEYFDTEFTKLFDDEPVCLAQNLNPQPGQTVTESNFQISKPKKPRKTPEVVDKKEVVEATVLPDKKIVSEQKDSVGLAGSKSINHGNWLKKAYYLKEAQKIVAEATGALEALRKKRTDFYEKIKADVDVLVNNFFKKVGVERGDFSGLCEYLEIAVGQKINSIADAQKDNAGGADEFNLLLYQIEERVDGLKMDLQSIKLEMESLVELDKVMFDRTELIEKHIASAELCFSAMQDDLNKIDQTFSHSEAFELYNKIEANYEKIGTINKYVQESAAGNFEKIKEAITANTTKFEEKIGKLNDEVNQLVEKLEKSSFKKIKTNDSSEANKQKKITLTSSKSFMARLFDWFLSWLF